MKVLSLLPRSRFTESGMTLPETLSLHFLPPNGSHVLIAAAESAQALLLPPSQPYVDAFCLERMPSIRFIQTTGAGFDSVDHLTAAELGIPVSNSPNMNASSVAEYVMAAIVNLQRGLAWADGEIRRGRYAASRAELLEQGGLELRGCRIGLFGLGNIGRAVVPLAKAFGCSCLLRHQYRLKSSRLKTGSSVWMWRSCSPSATWFPCIARSTAVPATLWITTCFRP